VLAAIPAQTATELSPFTFTATATDADIPAQTLTFSLVGAPAGAAINPATGVFTWTPAEGQAPGVYTFQVRVTDDGAPNLSDAQSVTVTVIDVNQPPVLAAIPDQTATELSPLSFTATATDADIPAETLTFSLVGAPTGAAIDPATGVFTWTPAEGQVGVFTFAVRVTDDGTPNLSDQKPVTVTVADVNQPPVLAPIPDQTATELSPLTFTATATDPDIPAQTLTFSLVGAPAGAAIDPATGVFTWTPAEGQVGVFTFAVRVTDDGTPNLSDQKPVTVTVIDVNQSPMLAAIPDQTATELSPLSFTATATDADIPAETLTFSLVGAPAGAAINPATGVFTWTPAEGQAPGVYTFAVRVTDDGIPNLSDQKPVTVTVIDVNQPPVLASILAQTATELSPLTFTATATDADIPAQTLTFGLVGAPAGAAIDPATGVFTWTPAEGQGPNTYTFQVRVTDDGTPSLSDQKPVTITVLDVNLPPVLAAIPAQTATELSPLTFTATATDPDIPAQTLTFSLVGAPAGAAIDPPTGVFTWTPAEGQVGPFTFAVRVTDDGTPNLSDQQSVTVTVADVNQPPVLTVPASLSVNAGSPLTFTAGATDPDIPAQTLTFSLVGAPAGAAIDSATGVFTWTPTIAQGGASYTFALRVTDNGTPNLSDQKNVTVVVNPTIVNHPPVLAAIPNQTVNEGSLLQLTATATDPDLPAEHLTFSLDSAPAGAHIDPVSGVFTWTPPDGPVTVSVIVRVTDDGPGNLSDTKTFLVSVLNVAPTATFNNNGPVDEGTPATFTFTNQSDPSAPDQAAGFHYSYDFNNDGVFDVSNSTSPTAAHIFASAGYHTVRGRITDKDGGFTDYTTVVYVRNVAPTVTITGPALGTVVAAGTPVRFTGVFVDPNMHDTFLALWVFTSPTLVLPIVVPGTIGPGGSVQVTVAFARPGVYASTLIVIDGDGGVGLAHQNTHVIVYDRGAGSGSGSGAAPSPAGAYLPDPTVTGRLHFDFETHYERNAPRPTGHADFQLEARNVQFHFRATQLDWLVIGDQLADLEGTGTVNGRGHFAFLLAGLDLRDPGAGYDRLRLRIWNTDTGAVVYDNGSGPPADQVPLLVISDGDIRIDHGPRNQSPSSGQAGTAVLTSGPLGLLGGIGSDVLAILTAGGLGPRSSGRPLTDVLELLFGDPDDGGLFGHR
jgi:hypothetical protein